MSVARIKIHRFVLLRIGNDVIIILPYCAVLGHLNNKDSFNTTQFNRFYVKPEDDIPW